MTMMTFRTNEPKLCGIVELDKQGIVVGFHEKIDSPPGNLANSAVYIVSNEMEGVLANCQKKYSDFSTEILPLMLGKIFSYETENFFIDIGTFINYKKANKFKNYENY
jgi:mannose-1-phosphate guanylyltransferase